MNTTDPIAIPHRDRQVYLGAVLAVLAYVVARAALVPWVHDECASLFWYAERGEWLPDEAHGDANNHFLSSALGIVGYQWWGLSLLGSRWASVLAFPLFAWAVFRLGGFIMDRRLRWGLWAALLACPFLLDFFSLFRGYGLSMAFWLVALDAGLRYLRDRRTGQLIALLLALLLANAAVLILLPVHALIVAVLPVSIVSRWKSMDPADRQNQSLAWLVLGPVPVAFAAWVAMGLQQQGLLYHGGMEGLTQVTLASLTRFVLGSDGGTLVYAVHLLLLLACVAAIARKPRWSPAGVVAALLLAEGAMRFAMAHLLGVNYPEDRAALHLVPLAVLLVALVGDRIVQARLRTLALVLLAFLPLRTLYTANVDHTLLWPEQSVPPRFLEQVATKQRGAKRPLIIGAYDQLHLAIPYGARLHGLPLDAPDTHGHPDGPHDVRIVDKRHLERALDGWHVADSARGPGLYLLLPDRSLRTSIYATYTFPRPEPTAEFVELWRGDTLSGDQDILVQVRMALTSDADFLDLRLVAGAKRAGEDLFYKSKPVAATRPRWTGEELHSVLRVPALPHADERVVYLWNPARVPVNIEPIEVKAHRTQVVMPH